MTPSRDPHPGLPTGVDLLHNARLNKSTAFTEAEREAFGLVGLLPEGVDTEEVQLQRVHLQLSRKNTDLEKYIYLSQLQDNDETLFYKALASDPAQFLPLVYTPTVGEACQQFSQMLRRPKGLFVSYKRTGRIKDVLRNWPERDVRVIVVTDGERVLGLGDLGANGMGIPVGKLALYTACAGVPPEATLPVALDVGTDNDALLRNPLYLGLRQPRVRGAAYDAFVDEFVEAVQEVFPRCCIQFEDFAGPRAASLLARWRDRVCCFNDDIQGTAAVAVAGLAAALRITGGRLRDQTFLFAGAGAAGTGIAGLLSLALQDEGLAPAEARGRCWLFDVHGLLTDDRTDLADFQRPFAHPHAPATDLLSAVEALRPTALIGVSTVPKLFNRSVVEAMARINARPILFPLSNPTSRSECTAEEAYLWTGGRAVFAGGSPFAPVVLGDRVFVPGQGNNVHVYPALGMAVYATEARRVTDAMFLRAARRLAELATPTDLDLGLVYPPISRIVQNSIHVTAAVAEAVFYAGLACVPRPADLPRFLEGKAYRPAYHSLI
jgi:malate dehydrogenase (oxaloacetate-decarboxylating)(NADP+)